MIDTSRITAVQLEDIDTNDYPDFADAYISDAIYMGREMTEAELDELNNDSGFVYEKVMEEIF
tara:strand:+ start:328 stop:516 length:189 start_codon:yes stop_codon:yes gene_type:complete